MALGAVLTVGWPEVDETDPFGVNAIHRQCRTAEQAEPNSYPMELSRILKGLFNGNTIILKGTDEIFRRRAGKFSDIKKFTGHLNELSSENQEIKAIHCEIDVFVYAFLKGAKNFHFFLPEIQPPSGPFRTIQQEWKNRIKALENFEREGTSSDLVDKETYLNLRRILSKPSARDERRSLATLLVSGPSTKEDIKDDLELPFGLGERILPTFQSIGILEKQNENFLIAKNALPIVLFCLREIMGIDLLATLDQEE